MPDFYGDLHAPIEWKPDGDFRDITYETAEGIAKITINRPEVRNAFRPQTLFELADAFNRARDDADVGVIIFTGAGDEAFCAGGDQRIRGDDGYMGDEAVAEKGIGRLNVLDLQIQIRRCPKPVVAMVAGWAMGGGHVLHVVCDLTIAADNAKFGQTGPRVGSFDGVHQAHVEGGLCVVDVAEVPDLPGLLLTDDASEQPRAVAAVEAADLRSGLAEASVVSGHRQVADPVRAVGRVQPRS